VDIPPSGSFTIANAGSIIFGAAAVAFFTWVQGVLRSRADRHYKVDDAVTAERIKADSEDRQTFRTQQQQFIDALRRRAQESEARVDELDREREKLWITIRDLRAAIELCEKKLGENEFTIRTLEWRVAALQNSASPESPSTPR
jgi:predicted RNase H-like nuclease (RuvC/YqgF family)